jgi:hypothetical protein
MSASIYFPPSMTKFIPRHFVVSAWEKHMSFGYDLIAAHRPPVVVELGTETGLSFFCFCQSMAEHEVEGVCYAVDSWDGDEHTGPYDEDVYEDVSLHATSFYPDLASLMRMRFNEAVDLFGDESIDLLHIDGCHTYEAASEDFRTWFPKVKPGGIILMHDTQVRWKDFGVWKVWEEESPRFDSFEFEHGFGLGVLRKPGGPVSREPMFELMFSGDHERHAKFRAIYVHITEHVELKRELARIREQEGPPSSEDDVPTDSGGGDASANEEAPRHAA